MLPDRASNPGPKTYESGALPIALRGPATPLAQQVNEITHKYNKSDYQYETTLKELSNQTD